MKHWFGTWTVLGLIIAGILLWLGFVKDPGELHLNLGLSFLASVQGVVLQIAANRGDRISAELAQHTFENGKRLLEVSEQILGLQNQQMNILADIHAIRDTIEGQGET
ncbi:MAG: hypothetical protein ACREBQ_13190 [Nitrososphaerales archaeon]